MAAEFPSFIASLGNVPSSGIIPAAGGVFIAGKAGQVLGAVDITGDSSDNDVIWALHGLATTGLQPIA